MLFMHNLFVILYTTNYVSKMKQKKKKKILLQGVKIIIIITKEKRN